MSSIGPSFSPQNYFPEQPIKPESKSNVTPSEESMEIELHETRSKPPEPSFHFPSLSHQVSLPVLPDSKERVQERQFEHSNVNQEILIQSKLKEMGKGLKRDSLPKRLIGSAASKGKDAAHKVWDNKGKAAKELPFGIGFLVEGIEENKEAYQLRKEVKSIEKGIINPNLSRKEKKALIKDINNRHQEQHKIEKEMAIVDKAIAKEYSSDKAKGVGSTLKAKLQERDNLKNALDLLQMDTHRTRRKLYDESKPDLDSSLAKMDQLVKEQKQVQRKGLGHTTRGVTGGGYHILSGGKVIAGIADVAEGVAVLTPVTAGFGLAVGAIEGSMHARNIAHATAAMSELKQLKYEGLACRANAMVLLEYAEDFANPPHLRAASAAKAKIEMAKADLIQDYIQNQKKLQHQKKVANTIGLGESTALVAASTCSLLSLIPEPTTSLTMYSLSLGITGLKYGLMLSEWAYDIRSEVHNERKESKLRKRRDFDVEELPEGYKGISKSFLGVEMRIAAMLDLGILPAGVQKFHGIIDEKGYVEHMKTMTQELGDKQMLKKGVGVIHDFAEYSYRQYGNMAEQLARLSNENAA